MKTVLMFSALVLVCGCDTFWHKTSYVSVSTHSFPDCAFQAISELEEVTVNDYWKKEGRVVGLTPYSMYEISINEYGNAQVQLYGRGLNPQPESSSRINTLLALLTKEVAHACNRN